MPLSLNNYYLSNDYLSSSKLVIEDVMKVSQNVSRTKFPHFFLFTKVGSPRRSLIILNGFQQLLTVLHIKARSSQAAVYLSHLVFGRAVSRFPFGAEL